jgi:hypothetical protein
MSKENLHTAAESTGTWRTYIAKEESAWCLVAKDVPEKYAATVSVNPCTALRMLQDIVDLKPGASVVQNGATSMVGQCVIQLARINDLHTINLIRDRYVGLFVSFKLVEQSWSQSYSKKSLYSLYHLCFH